MHWLIPVLVLASAAGAQAADIAVLLPATGANVGEGELTAATDILRGDLEQTGRFTVLLGRRAGGNLPEPTPAEAADEARAAGASLAVTLRISRLGSAITARLAAYAQDGRLLHADQLGASGPDDLDPVLRRLARGLAEARPAAELAEVDTVTERESSAQRRRAATRGFGLKLGAVWLVDQPGSHATHTTKGLGVFWLYDARAMLAELSLEGAMGGGDGLFSVGLGGYVPFGRGNVAPYLGAGVAYQVARVHEDVDAGLAFRGAAGVLFNRLSTVQFRLEGGYQVSTFTVSAHGERGHPQGPFVWGGIVF